MYCTQLCPRQLTYGLLCWLVWLGGLTTQPVWSRELPLTPAERAWLDSHPRIVLGISDQFKPDIFVDADGRQSGLIVDYFALLNQQLGNRLHLHVETNWQSVTEKAMRGEIDGLASSAPNPVWDQHFLYTRPFYHGYFHLYVRAGAPPLRRLEDLAGTSIGYLAGMKIVEQLVAGIPGVAMRAYTSSEAMAQALLEGEVDGLIGAIDLEWWRRQNTIMGFEISGFIESSRHPVLMSIRKDWPLLRSILDKALANIASADREHIKQTWLTTLTNPGAPAQLDISAAERTYLDGLRLRRAIADSWRPLAFVDGSGQNAGIAEDYWALIQDKLNLAAEDLAGQPLNTVANSLRNDQADLFVGSLQLTHLPSTTLFSASFEQHPLAIVMPRGSGFITSLSALQGQRVAVPTQGDVAALVSENYPSIDYLRVPDTPAALAAVASGEAIAAIDILPVLQRAIAARDDNHLLLSGVTDLQFELRIMLQERHHELLPLLNRAIAAITPEERLAIHKKWLLRDVVTQEKIDVGMLIKVALVSIMMILAILLWSWNLSREITRRRRAEQNLQETGERLRSILASMDDIVFVLDTEQRITDVYCHDPQRLMMPPDQFLNKSCREVLPEDIFVKLNAAIRASRHQGTQQIEYSLHTQSGLRWSQDSVSARFDGAGEFVGSTVVAHDITHRIDAQTALHQAKDAAEAANHAKSAFLANMSHELRTPLNAVLGYAQLLQRDNALNEAQRSSIDIIKRSGDHLLTLINDILDIAKIEAERLDLVSEPCHLPGVFADLEHLFALQAASKGLHFYCQTHDLPAWVDIDAKRLRQICMNLLGNAVKFTEQGEVRLTVSYSPETRVATPEMDTTTQCEGTLLIKVSDTGIGIPAAQHQAIFLPFAQVSDYRHAQHGAGLGLAICRSLVDLMGGHLSLDSESGKGSCFTLRLPISLHATVANTDNQRGSAQITGYQRSDGQTQPLRLLVADDEPLNRKLLIDLLQPLGFQVICAEDGEQAIALSTQQPVDLVLMDLVMPKLDGLAALRAMQQRQSAATPPVIMLSARAFDEDRAHCVDAGCRDFLSKPLQHDELLASLEKHLPLRWVLRDTAPAPTISAQMPTTPPAGIALPTSWLDALEQAMLRGKPELALSLLAELQPAQADYAAQLSEWITHYQYQPVIDWISQCRQTP